MIRVLKFLVDVLFYQGDYLPMNCRFNSRSFELQGSKGSIKAKAEIELEILMWNRGEGELEVARTKRMWVLRKYLATK